jgi:hypothetical protein
VKPGLIEDGEGALQGGVDDRWNTYQRLLDDWRRCGCRVPADHEGDRTTGSHAFSFSRCLLQNDVGLAARALRHPPDREPTPDKAIGSLRQPEAHHARHNDSFRGRPEVHVDADRFSEHEASARRHRLPDHEAVRPGRIGQDPDRAKRKSERRECVLGPAPRESQQARYEDGRAGYREAQAHCVTHVSGISGLWILADYQSLSFRLLERVDVAQCEAMRPERRAGAVESQAEDRGDQHQDRVGAGSS